MLRFGWTKHQLVLPPSPTPHIKSGEFKGIAYCSLFRFTTVCVVLRWMFLTFSEDTLYFSTNSWEELISVVLISSILKLFDNKWQFQVT